MVSLNELNSLIDKIISSLDLKEDFGWNKKINKVLVILSASRSGSSLVFDALSKSANIIAPAGEHEPWLFLTKNKFPYQYSDELKGIDNIELLLNLLRNDLLIRENNILSEEYLSLLRNRLALRQIYLPNSWYAQWQKQYYRVDFEVLEKIRINLANILSYERIKSRLAITNNEFTKNVLLPIENPPFIDQPLARRATDEELSAKTLLFKAPSDAYRSGLYENLFPNASIKFIHLTRGYPQTINGLIDGWTLNDFDYISNPTGLFDKILNIKGYSKSSITSNYWCFDLFPEWRKFTDRNIISICAMQWLTAHNYILDNFNVVSRLKFEDIYLNKEVFIKKLEDITGISVKGYNWNESIMSTDSPRQYRWHKRKDILLNLSNYISSENYNKVLDVNNKLGYSQDILEWR